MLDNIQGNQQESFLSKMHKESKAEISMLYLT